MTTTDRLLGQLRDRIRGAWDTGPLWVDPTVAPGLTDRQRSAVETATENAARSGLPVFVAVTPEIWIGHHDQWDAFTADLAFEMFDRTGEDQALVLFTEAETSARSRSYLVDGNGPSVPPNSQVLQRSSSDDFLPIELAVDYHLRVLVAAATGEPAPPLPDFDPVDVGESRGDYIEATGLDLGNPDGIVFGVSTLAALGLTAWVLTRKTRYRWKSELTTEPELVRRHRLVPEVTRALEPFPEPTSADEEGWAIRDRGLRVQRAIDAVTDAHPDWASSPDHSHRQAIWALVRTDRALRAMNRLGRRAASAETAAPEFCYFFPAHTKPVESIAWKQSGTVLTIDACQTCIADLDAGHDPVCLMVPKDPTILTSRPVPYFRRDDAYALSGFGSFTPLEDAILDDGVPGAERPVRTGRRS